MAEPQKEEVDQMEMSVDEPTVGLWSPASISLDNDDDDNGEDLNMIGEDVWTFETMCDIPINATEVVE